MDPGPAAMTGAGAGVRPATPADVPDVLRLARELAAYERAPDAVHASPQDYGRALFAPDPRVFCHVVEEQDGRLVGFALWYVTFSTWTGRHGLWLEDLFVEPEHRGRGHGLALLRTLAEVCVQRGYPRLEWWVLDWNESALRFYRSLGAVGMDEWTVQRLDGPALAALGRGLG